MPTHKIRIEWSQQGGFSYYENQNHAYTTHGRKHDFIKWECDYDFTIDFCDAASDPRKTDSPFEPPNTPCPGPYHSSRGPHRKYHFLARLVRDHRLDSYPYTVTLLNTGMEYHPQDDPEIQIDDTGGGQFKAFATGAAVGAVAALLASRMTRRCTR